jgi:hypothetical protein
MREYYYTIEKMVQIIAEYKEMVQIIAEYKVAEGIDTITEEDITNLFGDSYLHDNVYYEDNGKYYHFISDYEWYLLQKGYDPITGDDINDLLRKDYHYIPGIDTLQPYDVCSDFWICSEGQSMEEMLQTTLQAEREILIIDDEDRVHGSMPWDEYIQYWNEKDLWVEESADWYSGLSEEEMTFYRYDPLIDYCNPF